MLERTLKIGFGVAFFVTTLVSGLTMAGVYYNITASETEKSFDVNDSDSLPPIDFVSHKSSNPKKDGGNFDPRGFYYNEDLPKEFDEFAFLEIGADFYTSHTGQTQRDFQKLSGNVVVDVNSVGEDSRVDFIEFTQFETYDGNIVLKAETENGLQYTFRGKFLVKENLFTLDRNTKVLEGTLMKTKKGVQMAHTELEFSWTHSIGCCMR